MNKVLGPILIIVLFSSIAHGAESLWCRGPLEFKIRNHSVIDIFYMAQTSPGGRNGGKLKPGNCAYEKSLLSSRSNIQIIFQISDWKKSPDWMQAMFRSYIHFLSRSDYVVLMGYKGGQRFEYKSLTAIPFRKDYTQRVKKKMGAVSQ